jgi:WD40 repeat protein
VCDDGFLPVLFTCGICRRAILSNIHAKGVLNAEFDPNGFQLATAGDDGTIKICDLRETQTGSVVAGTFQSSGTALLCVVRRVLLGVVVSSWYSETVEFP